MPLSFVANATTLGGLLQGPHCFSMPVFQRPYTWDVAEAEQLLDDTLAACFIAEDDIERAYFIGILVLVAPPLMPQADGPQTWGRRTWGRRSKTQTILPSMELIDGKQRLMTLTILLAVLRDRMGEGGAFLHTMIATDAVLAKAGAGAYRLTSDDDETSFLVNCVQPPGATSQLPPAGLEMTKPNKRLSDVRGRFRERLTSFEPERLERYTRYLVDRCELSTITTTDYDVAIQLFTTINTKGSKLSTADILKAEILDDLPMSERAEAGRQWAGWSKRLGPGFDELFGQLKRIDPVSSVNIIRNTLGLVEKAGGAPAFLANVLWPSARNLEVILEASHAGAEQSAEINQRLVALGWWPSRNWLAPVLKVLNREGSDPVIFLEFLRAFEPFALRVNLRKLGHEAQTKVFDTLMDDIGDLPVNIGPKGPLALTAAEQQAALNSVAYHLHAQHPIACKVVLYRLNGVIDKSYAPDKTGGTSVEHILSRKAPDDDPGRAAFGGNAEFDRYAGSLGNLTPLESNRNREADRKPFPEKLDCYFKGGRPSAFALTNELRDLADWTPAALEARHERLMAIAQSIWGFGGDIRWRTAEK